LDNNDTTTKGFVLCFCLWSTSFQEQSSRELSACAGRRVGKEMAQQPLLPKSKSKKKQRGKKAKKEGQEGKKEEGKADGLAAFKGRETGGMYGFGDDKTREKLRELEWALTGKIDPEDIEAIDDVDTFFVESKARIAMLALRFVHDEQERSRILAQITGLRSDDIDTVAWCNILRATLPTGMFDGEIFEGCKKLPEFLLLLVRIERGLSLNRCERETDQPTFSKALRQYIEHGMMSRLQGMLPGKGKVEDMLCKVHLISELLRVTEESGEDTKMLYVQRGCVRYQLTQLKDALADFQKGLPLSQFKEMYDSKSEGNLNDELASWSSTMSSPLSMCNPSPTHHQQQLARALTQKAMCLFKGEYWAEAQDTAEICVQYSKQTTQIGLGNHSEDIIHSFMRQVNEWQKHEEFEKAIIGADIAIAIAPLKEDVVLNRESLINQKKIVCQRCAEKEIRELEENEDFRAAQSKCQEVLGQRDDYTNEYIKKCEKKLTLLKKKSGKKQTVKSKLLKQAKKASIVSKEDSSDTKSNSSQTKERWEPNPDFVNFCADYSVEDLNTWISPSRPYRVGMGELLVFEKQLNELKQDMEGCLAGVDELESSPEYEAEAKKSFHEKWRQKQADLEASEKSRARSELIPLLSEEDRIDIEEEETKHEKEAVEAEGRLQGQGRPTVEVRREDTEQEQRQQQQLDADMELQQEETMKWWREARDRRRSRRHACLALWGAVQTNPPPPCTAAIREAVDTAVCQGADLQDQEGDKGLGETATALVTSGGSCTGNTGEHNVSVYVVCDKDSVLYNECGRDGGLEHDYYHEQSFLARPSRSFHITTAAQPELQTHRLVCKGCALAAHRFTDRRCHQVGQEVSWKCDGLDAGTRAVLYGGGDAAAKSESTIWWWPEQVNLMQEDQPEGGQVYAALETTDGLAAAFESPPGEERDGGGASTAAAAAGRLKLGRRFVRRMLQQSKCHPVSEALFGDLRSRLDARHGDLSTG
jgi:hypothetical protein